VADTDVHQGHGRHREAVGRVAGAPAGGADPAGETRATIPGTGSVPVIPRRVTVSTGSAISVSVSLRGTAVFADRPDARIDRARINGAEPE